MHHERPSFNAHFRGRLADGVRNGGRSLVVAGPRVGGGVIPFHVLAGAQPGHHQRPGVRNHVVHAANKGVLLHAKVLDDLQQGVRIVLSVKVRFQQMGSEQMRPVLRVGVADDGIRNRYLAVAADQI